MSMMKISVKCLVVWINLQYWSINFTAAQKVWLEGPTVVDCRERVRLICHYCDIPLNNWTWSRAYGTDLPVDWQLAFRNGTQVGPSPVSMWEEVNGTVSLYFDVDRNMPTSWKCGVGYQESQTLTLRKECKPAATHVHVSLVERGKRQVMVTFAAVSPIPEHVNLTIALPPFKPVAVPLSHVGCTGISWAPECTWISDIPEGLVHGNYSYTLEVTTITKTVLTGYFS